MQSDVPEVSELCWLLMTGAPMGLLERCHAYKDKKAKGLTADAGLFTYPVLQAADILAYDSDTVPVGEDQVQHIEVCRDLAGSFNHQFGNVFVMPKAHVLDTSARVPGTDGEKMSKSYNNTLAVFEDAKAQRKQIMRIVTDSRPMDQPKEPAGDVLYDLYSLVATRRRARGDGRALSPRRLRLRRNEEGARRRGRKILGRTAGAAGRAGREAGLRPPSARRRRGQGPQESGRGAQAGSGCVWHHRLVRTGVAADANDAISHPGNSRRPGARRGDRGRRAADSRRFDVRAARGRQVARVRLLAQRQPDAQESRNDARLARRRLRGARVCQRHGGHALRHRVALGRRSRRRGAGPLRRHLSAACTR